jgi:hypothetical protein
MIILSIFGTARGLEVINFPLSNEPLPFQLENQWLEISLNDVALKPNIDTVFINRRMVAGNTLTWIGVYQHVFEMGYQRQGSFLGAGVWLINSMISADILFPILKNLAEQLKEKATNQVQFTRRIEEVKNEFSFNPSQLTSQEINITNGFNSFADLGFFAPKDHINDIQEMINWAQNARGADLFNRGYISPQDTFVAPVAGNSRKQVVLRSRGEADALYAKKLSEVAEQANQQNQQIQQAEKQLNTSQQRILQLESQNKQLQQDALNLKDQMSRQRSDFQRQLQQVQTEKPPKPNTPPRTTIPQNRRNDSIDITTLILGILSGLVIGMIGAYIIVQSLLPQQNENKSVSTPKSNPVSTIPSADEPSLAEDSSCKDLKLNPFALSISNRDVPKGEEASAETLAKNILQKVCQNPSSYEKFSSCKDQYKEFINSIEKIKLQAPFKGEIKLPNYCMSSDYKTISNIQINKTTIDIRAIPKNSPSNSPSNKPDKSTPSSDSIK